MKIFVYVVLTVCYYQILCKAQDCISGSTTEYSGTQSTTASGKTCQRWDSTTPHQPRHIPIDGGHHNYCRNPDNDASGTWCYTTDPSTRWESCGIPKCEVQADVVWTGYLDEAAFLTTVKADPEYVTKNYNRTIDQLFDILEEDAEFKALEVSAKGNLIFTDTTNNYLGVTDRKSQKTRRYLQGKADSIHSISEDPQTGNIYFTDTKTNTIIATDPKFKKQVSIFKSKYGTPTGVVVLSEKRKLAFSITMAKGSRIMVSDLSGRGVEEIVDLSQAKKITGLAADNERLYFTDNVGLSSKVMSCLHDGEDLRLHASTKRANYEDITVYSDYIYVTDSTVRYNYFDAIRYNVDVFNKNTEQAFTLSREEKPHGIAIIEEMKNEPEVDKLMVRCRRRCGGVCLPNRANRVMCRCSLGFFPSLKTKSCLRVKATFSEVDVKIKKSG